MSESILEEAERLTGEERRKEYGDPREHFEVVAKLWSDYLGVTFTAADVTACMMLLKVTRVVTGSVKRDTWVDICGYARLTVDLKEDL